MREFFARLKKRFLDSWEGYIAPLVALRDLAQRCWPTARKIAVGIGRYLWNWIVWVDQGCNTALGGDPDETLSSRMGKAIRENRCVLCRQICRVLNWIDPNHCQKHIEEDEGSRAIFR